MSRAIRVALPTGKPVKILGVELDEKHVLIKRDGTVRQSNLILVDEESLGRMMDGYMCPVCFEDQEPPLPDRCCVCEFRMRDQQSEFLNKHYIGNIRTGPSTTLEEEKLIMQEMREREARKLGLWTPKGGWI